MNGHQELAELAQHADRHSPSANMRPRTALGRHGPRQDQVIFGVAAGLESAQRRGVFWPDLDHTLDDRLRGAGPHQAGIRPRAEQKPKTRYDHGLACAGLAGDHVQASRELQHRVIDDAVLELSAGLNVVTGETGAGKTMVVSGLGLLLGARADAGLVRTGATKAVVEGVVQVGPEHPATLRAPEAGGDAEDDLILARTVSAEGRSRAHVGGRTVPISVLGELGELLVAVHGQSDQWRLRQPEQHRVVLDRFAGESVAEPYGRYTALYDELHQAGAELRELRGRARDRAREVDVLRAGLEEIEAVDPQPGEDLELRAEDERLAHADGLRASAGQAH